MEQVDYALAVARFVDGEPPDQTVQYRTFKVPLANLDTVGSIADLVASMVSYIQAKYPGSTFSIVGGLRIVY